MQIGAAANRNKRADRRVSGICSFIVFDLVQVSGNSLRFVTLSFVGSSYGLSAG